jgi:hypothetical protein
VAQKKPIFKSQTLVEARNAAVIKDKYSNRLAMDLTRISSQFTEDNSKSLFDGYSMLPDF